MPRFLVLAVIAALALPSLGCARTAKPVKKKPSAEQKDDAGDEKKDATVPGTDPTTPVNPTNPVKPPGSGF